MQPRSLQYVLRNLTDSGPPVPDAELLRRFLANDEPAFAELVRRHGRLVWAVCRHLTRSDAEADDAFQATFLVLLKNAAKVREAGKLSAWLHGVAYKVCAKSRLAAQRRQVREQVMAVCEGNGSAVPDSAWDRALAAVHEEVAKLPETLRVPFVLCCLEGLGVTEAAEKLGWKLGTLSGRLTRAKDAVLHRLEARGLTLGVVASVGAITVPTAVVAKAEALAQVGFAVPSSILQLSQGVLGMSMKSMKLLAAAVMLTIGLGWTLGTGWVANAEAQTPGALPKPTPQDEVKRLQAELLRARRDADEAEAMRQAEVDRRAAVRLAAMLKEEKGPTFTTTKCEYDLVVVSEMTQTKFREFLQDRENRGWEFTGTTPLTDPKSLVWVFRRPLKGGGGSLGSGMGSGGSGSPGSGIVPGGITMGSAGGGGGQRSGESQDAKAIEAEIQKLQDKLAALKKKSADLTMVVISYQGLSDGAALKKLLLELGENKFGKGSIQVVEERAAGKFMVSGTKQVTDWAASFVKQVIETGR